MTKKVLSPEEYKARSVTVNLNAIEGKAHVPPIGQQPHAPNVKIDPIATAVATEIISKYPQICLNKDGSLNHEGFKTAAIIHLRAGNQRPTVKRINEHLTRR